MNSIHRAFRRKKEKKWPKLFIFVDLHETIITPTYNRFNVGAEFYPYATMVLRRWTRRDDICLVLWTSSHADAIEAIRPTLAEHGIKFDYVNRNPEQVSNNMCDFSGKPYFDIVIDDKGFFDAKTDWKKIHDTLVEIGEW